MGNSQPPQASGFDLVNSFAHRTGSEIRLVLADPAVEVPPEAAFVLRRGGTDVRGEGELAVDDAGRRLVVRAPLAELTNGEWSLHLAADGGPAQLDCRLLVQGERPPVLLWGASALPSRLPTPHPRRKRAPAGQAGPTGPAARAKATLSRVRRVVSRRVRRSG